MFLVLVNRVHLKLFLWRALAESKIHFNRLPNAPEIIPILAALDDAMSVWIEAINMAEPKNMAIFGSSTGGTMTLAIVLRAKDEHLPLPAAIAPGTPWSCLAILETAINPTNG